MEEPIEPAEGKRSGSGRACTVALLPWGDLIEDFLDGIDISLEAFCTEMSGGWLFGYVEALRSTGIRTVVFCVSGRVSTVTRYRNGPTGAEFCILPATATYLRIRRRMQDPYGASVAEVFGPRKRGRKLYGGLRALAPYLATPVPLLMRELRRAGCDAVLCQEYEYPRFDVCVLAGKLLRLPVFATFQGGDRHRSRLEGLLRPYTVRTCAGLIIGPEREIRRVRSRYGLTGERIANIANPLDVHAWKNQGRMQSRAELGISESTRVAIWHGRVDIHRKGLDVLLDAWRRVLEQHEKDRMLVLVGTGDDAEKLRRHLAALPSANVLWLDTYLLDRERIRSYLSAADLYVLPSRHEGFPVAPVEAMACGLPVVAADAPGVREIVGDLEAACGRIVARGDAAQLGKELEVLLADDDLARAMGANARRRVHATFSTSVVGEQLNRFIRPPDGTYGIPAKATSGGWS